MKETDILFFELIRVAIGTQESLSRLPSEAEWEELFEMAVKQSLVGVCFVGLHTLGADSDEGYTQIGMSEDLFFDWMGMAAQINMKNDLVNEQCVELQAKLFESGFRNCILKGQGVATLYGEELSGFHQSGDIDMLVDCNYKKAALFVSSVVGKDVKWAYKDFRLEMFEDTEVELHIKPGLMFNPFHNHRWQKWYADNRELVFGCNPDGQLNTPSIEFNSIYILQHCYMHLFESGIGLRQFMDYYFVLKTLYNSSSKCRTIENFQSLVKQYGMTRFARGVMYIMESVFGFERECLLCEPDANEGEFLLKEIMQGGNFGKFDDRFKTKSGDKEDQMKRFVKRSCLLVGHYPQEALLMLGYFVWHYIVKKIRNKLVI